MDGWTEERVLQLLDLLTAINDYLPTLGFILCAICMGVGFCAGGMTWRLVILAKNQRSIWALVVAGLLLSNGLQTARAEYGSVGAATQLLPGPEYAKYHIDTIVVNNIQLAGWGQSTNFLTIIVGISIGKEHGPSLIEEDWNLVGHFKQGESKLWDVCATYGGGNPSGPNVNVTKYLKWNQGGHEWWCQALYLSWSHLTSANGGISVVGPCTFGTGNGVRNTIGYCVDQAQDSGDVSKWVGTIKFPAQNNLCPSQAGSTNGCTTHCSGSPCVDTDGDGICDSLDPDDDSDGVPDECDKDPKVYHSGNIDYDCDAPGCCEANEAYCGPCVGDPPPPDDCTAPKIKNPETGECGCPAGMSERSDSGLCYCNEGTFWNEKMNACTCKDTDGDGCCDEADEYPSDSTKGCGQDMECDCSFDWEEAFDTLSQNLGYMGVNISALGGSTQQDINYELRIPIGFSAGDFVTVYLHTKFDWMAPPLGPMLEWLRLIVRGMISLTWSVFTLRLMLKTIARW